MSRTLLVSGLKEFRIQIPDDARVTFGPFSPPSSKEDNGRYGNESKKGTLRIYQGTKDNVIGVFTNVDGFRDISQIDYQEKVTEEKGATIWESDREGYVREEKVTRTESWVDPLLSIKQLSSGAEKTVEKPKGVRKPKVSAVQAIPPARRRRY